MPPKPYGTVKAASKWHKKGNAKLREKISAAERELVQKVVDDERYNHGREKIVQQLEKGLNPDLDTDENKDVEEEEEEKPEGTLSVMEAIPVPKTPSELFQDWANYCIRLCLEVWDVERNVFKVTTLKKETEKLEKNQTDAHKSYMQELSALRNRIYRLEKKGSVEFDLTKDDLIFYEPLQYLSDAGREMVKDIIVYKMKDELTKQATADVGGPSPDKTAEMLNKVKEKERKIKELEEKLGDALYEAKLMEDGHRARENAALDAAYGGVSGGGESGSQEGGASSNRRASNKRQLTASKSSAQLGGSGQSKERSSVQSSGQLERQEEFGESDEEALETMARKATGQSEVYEGDPSSAGGAMPNLSNPEVRAKMEKMKDLKCQIAEAKGVERELQEELAQYKGPGFSFGPPPSKSGSIAGSRDSDAGTAGAAEGAPKKVSKEEKKRQRDLEDQLKKANRRITELEGELKREFKNFDDGVMFVDCGVGPGPGAAGGFGPGAGAGGGYGPGAAQAAGGVSAGPGGAGGFGPGAGAAAGGFGPGAGAAGSGAPAYSFGPGGGPGPGDGYGPGPEAAAGGGFGGPDARGGGFGGDARAGGRSSQVAYDGGPAGARGAGQLAGPGGPAGGAGRGGSKAGGSRAAGKKARTSIKAGGSMDGGAGAVYAEAGDESDYYESEHSDEFAPVASSDPSSATRPEGRAPRSKHKSGSGSRSAARSAAAAAAGSAPGSAAAFASDAGSVSAYDSDDDYDYAGVDPTSSSMPGSAPAVANSSGTAPEKRKRERGAHAQHATSAAAGKPRPGDSSPGGESLLSALAEEAVRRDSFHAEDDLDYEPDEPTQSRGQQPHKGQRGGSSPSGGSSPVARKPASRSRPARVVDEHGEPVSAALGGVYSDAGAEEYFDDEEYDEEAGHSHNLENALEKHIERKRGSVSRGGGGVRSRPPVGPGGVQPSPSFEMDESYDPEEADDSNARTPSRPESGQAVAVITKANEAVHKEMKATKQAVAELNDDIQSVQALKGSSGSGGGAADPAAIAERMKTKVARVEQQLEKTAKAQAKLHRSSVAAVATAEAAAETAEAELAEAVESGSYAGTQGGAGKRSSMSPAARKKGSTVRLQGAGNDSADPAGDFESDDDADAGADAPGGGSAGAGGGSAGAGGSRAGARAGSRSAGARGAGAGADAGGVDRAPELNARIDALKDKNSELEIAVQEMQEKLKAMRKALKQAGMEKKGYEIFEQTGLAAVLKAKPKLPVFTRLYNDAIDRVKKSKEIKQLTKTTHAEALLSTLQKIYRPHEESIKVTQLLPPAEPLSPAPSRLSPATSAPLSPKQAQDMHVFFSAAASGQNEAIITPEMLKSLQCCTCGGYRLPPNFQPERGPQLAEQANQSSMASFISERPQQPGPESPQMLRNSGRTQPAKPIFAATAPLAPMYTPPASNPPAFSSTAPLYTPAAPSNATGQNDEHATSPSHASRPRSRQLVNTPDAYARQSSEEDAHDVVVRGEKIDLPEGLSPKSGRALTWAKGEVGADDQSPLDFIAGPAPWPVSVGQTRPPSAARPPSSQARQAPPARTPLSPTASQSPVALGGLSPPSSAASPSRPYSPSRPASKLDNSTGAGRRNRERERDKEEDSLTGHMAAYQLRMTQELQASRLKLASSLETPKQELTRDKKSMFPLASSEEAINELDLLRPSTHGGFPRSFSSPTMQRAGAPGAPASWGWGGVSTTALNEKLTSGRETPTLASGTRPTVMAAASHIRSQDLNALPRLEGSNILPPASREGRELQEFGASQESVHVNDGLLAGLKDGSKSTIIFAIGSGGNASASLGSSGRSPQAKTAESLGMKGAKTLPASLSALGDFDLPSASRPAIAGFAADDFQRTMRRNENSQARQAPPPKMLMRGKPAPDLEKQKRDWAKQMQK